MPTAVLNTKSVIFAISYLRKDAAGPDPSCASYPLDSVSSRNFLCHSALEASPDIQVFMQFQASLTHLQRRFFRELSHSLSLIPCCTGRGSRVGHRTVGALSRVSNMVRQRCRSWEGAGVIPVSPDASDRPGDPSTGPGKPFCKPVSIHRSPVSLRAVNADRLP